MKENDQDACKGKTAAKAATARSYNPARPRLRVLVAFLYRQTILIPVGVPPGALSHRAVNSLVERYETRAKFRRLSDDPRRSCGCYRLYCLDAHECILSREKHLNARFAESECI